MTKDSTGIVFAIDTGWSDDQGIGWNPRITYGLMTDSRDGKVYRTVQIGAQTWMAENLNYAGNGNKIGMSDSGNTDSCTKYGRRYTWSEVMAGATSSSASPSGVQGVCPAGWHVPSDAEWTTMQRYVEPTNTMDGTKLKSTSGWLPYKGISGNGTDTYGFRALPGGDNDYSADNGAHGKLWSATNLDATTAWNRFMSYGLTSVVRNMDDKTNRFSFRCSQSR
jgi:uncharacterized protein (TIGR02145 family)